MKKMYVLLVALLVIMLLSDELKSQTSELQWETLNIGTKATIAGIASISTDTIIACGSDGTIIKSVDSGKTWQQKNSRISSGCSEIKFANHKVGYIIAGSNTLLKTVDGGETWTEVYKISVPRDGICKLFLVDADTLYMENYSGSSYVAPNCSPKLVKSTNGGRSWSDKFICPEPLNEYEGVWLNEMFFVDNVGYIVVSETMRDEYGGYIPNYKYTIYKSVDFGNTWLSAVSFNNTWKPPIGHVISCRERPSVLFFTDVNSGLFYSENGLKIITKNGFETFTTSNDGCIDFADFIVANFQINGKHSIAYRYTSYDDYPETMDQGRNVSHMKYSNDNGETWTEGRKYSNSSYYSIQRVGDSVFYLGITGALLRSPAFPVGINENKIDINVYLNQATNELIIRNLQFIINDVSIYDLMGRLRKITKISLTEGIVNLTDLKTGVYLVKISTKQGSVIKKITKQ